MNTRPNIIAQEPVPHVRRTAPLDPARPDRDHSLVRILQGAKAAWAAGTGQLMRADLTAHLVYGTTAAAALRLLSPVTKHPRHG